MSPRWTAKTPLPGGDFDWAKFEDEVDEARAHWKFLGEQQARRMVAAYGSRLVSILGEAKEKSDLGPAFGPDLTGAEVRYLMTKEWARFPDDILWRRSKLGLTMPAADREALAAFMAQTSASRHAKSVPIAGRFHTDPELLGAFAPVFALPMTSCARTLYLGPIVDPPLGLIAFPARRRGRGQLRSPKMAVVDDFSLLSTRLEYWRCKRRAADEAIPTFDRDRRAAAFLGRRVMRGSRRCN